MSFDCQHGEKECEANIIHCCSIEAIHDPSTKLNFVACMIRDNNNPQEAFQRVCESRSCYENNFNYKFFHFLVFKRVHGRCWNNSEMLQQFAWERIVENCWRSNSLTSTLRKLHSNCHIGRWSTAASDRLTRRDGWSLQSIGKRWTFTQSLRECVAINLALASRYQSINFKLEQSFIKHFVGFFRFSWNERKMSRNLLN